jgi:hypothetical protein
MESAASSFNRSCYERDNGYKTHQAKRSCLLQAHYKNDDNLQRIPKRKQKAIWQSTSSLDHFIGSIQHRLRNGQTDLLCRLKVYHQLKLRGLLHRQIGRLGSLQDSVHIICDATVAVREVRRVGHEPAGIYSFSAAVHRR